MDTISPRYDVKFLQEYAAALFAAAGCDGDKPAAIAAGLIEADLLGHTTHGLQLAPTYLGELERGAMAPTGEPEIINDRGAAITWNGRKLPGIWLTRRAVELAIERAAAHGVTTIAIRQSHHIGCLAVFLQQATDRGLMIVIASSDPAFASVAPFGGIQAVLTPNPIAVGIPTEGDPILIDISTSITTNGMTGRLRREGKRYPGLWARDAEGNPTDDPETMFTQPPGTLLPAGGLDHGHKGFGLALMVEALTQGLSGFGRADAPTGLSALVFIQVIDPELFGGRAAFAQQTDFLASACRDNAPVPGADGVRLPGQRGLELKRKALAEGVVLYPNIMEALEPFAAKWGVKPPPSL